VKPLPQVCQTTGQVTCSNLTDISVFPQNTNVEFTNIFDNQIDFARVDYLALEYVLITADPPPPPPTITSIRLGGNLPYIAVPVQSVGNSEVIYAGANVGDEPLVTSIAEGPINILVGMVAEAIPQYSIGTPLITNEAVTELNDLYVDFFSDSVPWAAADLGSLGSRFRLEEQLSDTSITMPNQVSLLQVGSTLTFEQITGPGHSTYAVENIASVAVKENSLIVRPIGDAPSPADFDLPPDQIAPNLWGSAICVNGFVNEHPSVNFSLEALMSDGSVIPLGSFVFKISLAFNAFPFDFVERSPAYLEFDQKRILWTLPFPPWIHGDVQAAYGVAWAPIQPPTVTKITPSNSGALHPDSHHLVQPGEHQFFTASTFFNFMTGAITASADPPPLPPTNLEVTPMAPLTTEAARRRTRCAPRYEIAPYNNKRPRIGLTLTPTYDNLMQIICSELEVDRTAGAYSSQLLAVVPFDYSELADGYYLIKIPVNSLVWRKLADVHVRNLTFGIYNGVGVFHPALIGQPFTVTLGLRYI
jgi:hypothetical protein